MFDRLSLFDGVSLHLNIDRGVASVVVTLAWPSHWLIVNMSTPARNK
jgi:hypothetical protein